ncbi:MAG: hypothetical protein WDN31_06135 [Hyphomicrobium sp.]
MISLEIFFRLGKILAAACRVEAQQPHVKLGVSASVFHVGGPGGRSGKRDARIEVCGRLGQSWKDERGNRQSSHNEQGRRKGLEHGKEPPIGAAERIRRHGL